MTEPAPPSTDVAVSPEPRPETGRSVAVVVGLLLVVLMLFLGFRGPRFVATGGDEDIAVTCGSVLTVGWPTDGSYVAEEDNRAYGDHVRSGDPDFVARDGIARDCSERRGTYLGLMVLLAVPASVCLGVGLSGRRRP